jgi:prepilin-type N-terminal cleavage/methylation domain-containing protein
MSPSARSGFTLLEIIVVIALLALLTAGVTSWGMSDYFEGLSRNDENTILTSLVQARAESIAGLCDGVTCQNASPHGVFFTPKSATIFEGPSYEERATSQDEILPLSGNIKFTGLTQVVFASITGDGESNYSIPFTMGSSSEGFLISTFGQISPYLPV